MILTKRFSCTFVLLLSALTLCCFISGTYAARITNKSSKAATTTTTEAIIANATNTELSTEVVASSEEEEEEGDEDEDEKTAVAANDTTSPGIWGMMRGLWNWLRDDLSESLLGDDSTKATTAVEGRTFGKIRRLKMALIPIVLKIGLLSVMVSFLVVLGLKTFFLLKLLVLMNAVAILAKFLTFKKQFGGGDAGGHYEHSAPTWGGAYSNWSPQTGSGGWASTAPAAPEPHHPQHPTKEIHLHIHGAQAQPQVAAYSSYGSGAQVVQQQQQHGGWERQNDPYAAYEPAPAVSESEMETEFNSSAAPIGVLPTRYAANHRVY